MDDCERRLYSVDVTQGNPVEFKLAPLVANAGMKWMFRIRFDYRNWIVMTSETAICEVQSSDCRTEKRLVIKDSCKSDELAAAIHKLASLKNLYYEPNANIHPKDTEKKRLVWIYAKPLDEIVSLRLKDDGLIAGVGERTRFALPYMITCSLAPKCYVHTLKTKHRVAHVFSPPDGPDDHVTTVGEWMPVAKEFPEEITVRVRVLSARGSPLRFWYSNTIVTIELKQV